MSRSHRPSAIRPQPDLIDPGAAMQRAALDALSDALDWAYGGARLRRYRRPVPRLVVNRSGDRDRAPPQGERG